MDNKTFINTLSERCSLDQSAVQHFTDALAGVLREQCGNLATVAVPGFGSFSAVKTNEYTATDPQSGKTLLYPPKISMEFTPGAMLKKHIRNEQ